MLLGHLDWDQFGAPGVKSDRTLPPCKTRSSQRLLFFIDGEQVPLPPHVVALAIDVVPWCLARLLSDLLLVSFDPIELREGEDPDRVFVHARRRGDAHVAAIRSGTLYQHSSRNGSR